MPIDKNIDGKGSEQFISEPQLYTGTSPLLSELHRWSCSVALELSFAMTNIRAQWG